MERNGARSAPYGYWVEGRESNRNLIGIDEIGNGQIVAQDQRRDGGFSRAVGAADDDHVGLGHVLFLCN